MEKYNNFSNRESGKVIGGLLLVAVGAALLLRNMGFLMPGWLFSWPMILILVGTYIGFKSGFRNNAWFILMAFGGYFLVSRFIPSLGLEPIFWPALIIALGLIFILRPNRNRWANPKTDVEYNKWKTEPATSLNDPVNVAPLVSSDYLVIDSVFSGINRKVVSKNFQGGRISCVFGGSEIELSQADITGPVYIRLDIVFGGVKLIVPPHWAIQNEINGAFHAVDDKRHFNPSSTINPDKVLVLKGSVVFGGVEIKSF